MLYIETEREDGFHYHKIWQRYGAVAQRCARAADARSGGGVLDTEVLPRGIPTETKSCRRRQGAQKERSQLSRDVGVEELTASLLCSVLPWLMGKVSSASLDPNSGKETNNQIDQVETG